MELIGGDLTLDLSQSNSSSTEMWMLLLIRMVTRVAELPIYGEADRAQKTDDDTTAKEVDSYARQDQLRQTLVQYVMADFSSRCGDALSY